MTRPLFDPDRARGPEKPVQHLPEGAISVTALASLVSQALESGLPARVRVVGEISNFNDRTHWYFRLKDDGAVMDCVMFGSAARKTGLQPVDGQKVLLTGRVEFYGKQGRTQFYAEKMESIGAGDLERKFRELCAELKGLGWFDPSTKRELPSFPRRIAIVTSKTGAALQDVLNTMQRRCPAIEILLCDVRVQGDGAAAEIAAMIRHLSAHRDDFGLDAILLTRGGGSIEDLWAFNERVVAQAIHECALPIVAAIGHETDTTIAELVADQRAATPTQAVMVLTPDRESLSEELTHLSKRLRLASHRRFDRDRERAATLDRRLRHSVHRHLGGEHVKLERLSSRLAHMRPEAVYAARRARIGDLMHRLVIAMDQVRRRVDPERLGDDLWRAWHVSAERRRQRLDALERELIVASPISVLRRGYSVTTRADGAVVRSADEVKRGDKIITRLPDGSIHSIVESGEESSSLPTATPALPARNTAAYPLRARRRAESPDQMKLF